jgi:O-antigen/teichoic acid export membrane protein
MNLIHKTIQTLGTHSLIFLQSVILIPIIIKLSGSEVYGQYALFSSCMGFIFGISSVGVGVHARRRLPSTNHPIEKANQFFPQFNLQIVLVIFFGFLFLLACKLLNQWTEFKFQKIPLWIIPTYLLTFSFLSQICDYFRFTHRIGTFNLGTALQPYIFLVIALFSFMITMTLDLNSLVLSQIMASVIVFMLLFPRLYHEIGFRVRFLKIHELRLELLIGYPLVLSYIVDFILSSGDRFIIANMLSVKDVGHYVSAYALGSITMIFPRAISVVLLPTISRLIDLGDNSRANELLNKSAYIYLLISIPYFVGTILVGRNVLEYYTTQEIAKLAWPVLSLVAFASIFYGLMLFKSNIVLIRLNTKAFLKVNLTSAIINITINIFLLSVIRSVIIPAAVTVITYMFSFLWLDYMMKKDSIKLNINYKDVLYILFSSFGMGLVVVAIQQIFIINTILTTVTSIFFGVISYCAILYLFPKNRKIFADFFVILKAK